MGRPYATYKNEKIYSTHFSFIAAGKKAKKINGIVIYFDGVYFVGSEKEDRLYKLPENHGIVEPYFDAYRCIGLNGKLYS